MKELTSKQQEIYSLIVSTGAERAQIANILKISEKTLKNHLSEILAKYKVKNQKELIIQHYKQTSGNIEEGAASV